MPTSRLEAAQSHSSLEMRVLRGGLRRNTPGMTRELKRGFEVVLTIELGAEVECGRSR